MPKLLTLFIALGAIMAVNLSAPTKAAATCMALTGAGKANCGSASSSCTQATNFLARTSGLSGTETSAYTTLICGMVTDGIITGTLSGANGCGSVLDTLYILATNTQTTALLNLCGTNFTATTFGSVTFTADAGFQGDGSSGLLDTHYTPSTNAINVTLNGMALGVFDQTVTSGTPSGVVLGAGNGSFDAFISPGAGSATWEVNGATFPTAANASAKGALVASRNGSSSATSLYKNGSSAAIGTSGTDTSGALANQSVTVFCIHQPTVGCTNFDSDQASAFFISAGLTGAQAVLINNRINAYLLALGHNVY